MQELASVKSTNLKEMRIMVHIYSLKHPSLAEQFDGLLVLLNHFFQEMLLHDFPPINEIFALAYLAYLSAYFLTAAGMARHLVDPLFDFCLCILSYHEGIITHFPSL